MVSELALHYSEGAEGGGRARGAGAKKTTSKKKKRAGPAKFGNFAESLARNLVDADSGGEDAGAAAVGSRLSVAVVASRGGGGGGGGGSRQSRGS